MSDLSRRQVLADLGAVAVGGATAILPDAPALAGDPQVVTNSGIMAAYVTANDGHVWATAN